MTEKWVENPPHVDATRMRHISDDDLFAAFAPVVQVEGRADRLSAWRSHFARRSHPTPWFNLDGWAAAVRGSEREREVIAQADATLARTVDFTDRGLGKSGLYGFHYLNWLLPLIQAYACTRDERYVEGWRRFFGQWYATRDEVRGDWPGLDVIWYTLGVGLRGDVIARALQAFRASPALPDAIYGQMLKTLLGGARWLYEEHDAFRHGNWQLAGCGALLNLAGFFPELPEASAWAARARARIEEHLELDVYPDGGHYERAPGYHVMCMNVLRQAAISAEQNLGWSLAAHPRFAAMYDWLLTMTTGAGWAPPFNDCQIVWSGSQFVYGHYFLRRPEYKAMARRFLPEPEIAALLGSLPARPGEGAPPAGFASATEAAPSRESCLLPESKYAILRGGWGRDGLYAALNYGPFVGHELEPHSHLAGLDFVLAGWGAPLAWEAGGPNTYDDPLYYNWYRATRAHNTIVGAGLHTAEDRDATLLHFAALPTIDVIAAEHRGTDGATHRRTLLFVRPGDVGPPYWLVRDCVTGVPETTWLLHGPAPWAASGPQAWAAVAGPGLLVLPADAPVIDVTGGASGPCRVPDSTRQVNQPGELHTLALRQAGGNYDVALLPFRERAPRATIAREDATLTLHLDGGIDRFGECWWTRERDRRLVAAACWGQPTLTHAGRVLVAAPALQACSLTWQGESLEAVVETTAKTALAFHAPGASSARVNGVIVPSARSGAALIVAAPCAGRYTVLLA